MTACLFKVFIILIALTCLTNGFFLQPIDRVILSDDKYSQSAREPFNPLTNCPTNSCTTTSKSATDPRTCLCACSLSSSWSSSSSSSSSSLYGFIEKQETQEGEEVGKSSFFTALPHVMDLTTYMIQDIISFSKGLRDFR